MKVPTLTGSHFEHFDLAFTSAVSNQNDLIGIPFDYLLRPDAVGNYNGSWNNREEKPFFFILQGQAFNDDTQTLYNLVIKCVCTYETGSNTVSCHTRYNNGSKCYLVLKGNLKTEAYEETKASKSHYIIQSTHYDGNTNFTLDHY